jgi:hypothetical protein
VSEIICEKCQRTQPSATPSAQCLYCGAALPEAVVAPPAPTVTESPVAPVAPATPAGEEPVPEGKRRCPGCGEVLYAEEKRCWRCGAELAPAAVAGVPVAPPAPLPVAAATPTPAATPVIVPVTAPATPPYVPPAVPAGPDAPVDAAAQTLGIWALVLSLLGLICCPPIIPSIIAVILGAKARAGGAVGLGTAGLVIGIIGLVVSLLLTALVLWGLTLPSTPTPVPETSSWLGVTSWLFA